MKTVYVIVVIAFLAALSQRYFNGAPLTANAVAINSGSAETAAMALESLHSNPKYADYVDPESVILFSTSWCPYCKKAREYLNRNQIEFVEFDVEEDRKARHVYDRLNSDGVPVLLVKGKYVDGFDTDRFAQAYGLR